MKKLTVLVNNYVSGDYIELLKQKFKVNTVSVHDFMTKLSTRRAVDLILFPGGADVNPNLYNEKLGKYTNINKEQDEIEKEIFYSAGRRTLKLGICRGAQFLTVMNGGRLIQHVEEHTTDHDMKMNAESSFMPYEIIEVTSTHHQMMYPFDLPDHKYDLLGWSQKFRSTTYLDGLNEEMDLDDKFLEPEIIHYPGSNSLCIQGHPEFPNAHVDFRKKTFELIEAYLK